MRDRTPTLTDDHRSTILGSIQRLSILGTQVEKAMGSDDKPTVHRMNDTVSQQIDRLYEVLVALQDQIEKSRQ